MRHRAAVLSEYGLLVALIAVVAVAGVTIFGNTVASFFACLPFQLGLDPKYKGQTSATVTVGTASVTCTR